MTFTVSVIYPKLTTHDLSQPIRFDFDYYLNKHVAGAIALQKPLGLLSWRVVSFLDDPASPFAVQTTLDWPDEESASKALGNEKAMRDMAEDLRNFTDLEPVVVKGRVMGAT